MGVDLNAHIEPRLQTRTSEVRNDTEIQRVRNLEKAPFLDFSVLFTNSTGRMEGHTRVVQRD